MENLNNKVVVITGGASGVGRGMAEAFADAGARLLLVDINVERLVEMDALLGPKTEVVTRVVDLRDISQIAALAAFAYETFGAVHVLCNNAGVACYGLLWEAAPTDWDWLFETNVRAIAEAIRQFVPRMLTQGEPAHIVNTSSMVGLSNSPLTGLYGASKQAVLGITEALRMELALSSADIGVSVLCSGPVKTNVKEEPGRNVKELAKLPEALAQVEAILKGVIEDGMSPRQVGDCVLQAVKEGRFWILPAPELIDTADQRLAEIHASIA